MKKIPVRQTENEGLAGKKTCRQRRKWRVGRFAVSGDSDVKAEIAIFV